MKILNVVFAILLLLIGAIVFCKWFFYAHMQPQLRIVEARFREGLAVSMGDDEKLGYINPQGEWVIPPCFDNAYDFLNSHTVVQYKGKWGIIDKTGKYVFPSLLNNSPGFFSEDLCIVEANDGKIGYIDQHGTWRISPQFEDGTSFVEGLAGVKINGKWGFINKKGELIIPADYKEIKLFENGVASVKLSNDSWAKIDKQGNIKSGNN